MGARPAASLLLLLSVLPPAAAAEPQIQERSFTRVILSGNEAFSDRALRSVMGISEPSPLLIFRKKRKFTEKDLESKVEDLRRFYQRSGYFESSVSLVAGESGEARVEVREGEPCRVETVSVAAAGGGGWPEGVSGDLLLRRVALKRGDPFSADQYEKDGRAVLEYLWEAGFASARLEPDAEVDLKTHLVAVTYTVSCGPRCVFGPALFPGLDPSRRKAAGDALAFKEGEPYKKTLVDKSVRQLYDLSLFDGVSVAEKVDDAGKVTVRFRLMEGRPRKIRLSAGYGSDENLRGEAGWENAAFLNRPLTAGLKLDQSHLRSEGTVYFRKPYAFGGRFTAGVQAQYKREALPDFTYQSLDFRAGLDQRSTERLTGALYGRFEHVLNVNPKTDVDQALLQGEREVVSIVSVVGSAVYRRTDDILDPTRGFVLSATVEPASVLETHVDFVSAVAEARYYHPLAEGVVGAFKLKAGAILSKSDLASIPLNRRFYAGGANSVRGYTYMGLGPLSAEGVLTGGKGLTEASAEIRFPVKGPLRGVVFVDAGNATLEPFKLDKKLYASAGTGLRYKTPVGPVGVDVAFKLRKDPLDSKAAMIYLFVGYAF
jgi:outer membrane protein assembly complex protein YaeT